MKWYKRDPNAFSDGVACLTLEEVGAYCLILEAWYARDGELRDDDWLLSRILRCDIRRVRRLKNTLISRGKIWVDRGKIEAKSARLRLEEARKYSASQAEVANKRWKKVSKNKDPPHADMALPPQPQPQPQPDKERKIKTLERSPLATGVSEKAFQEFWQAYPKRSGANPKHPARKSFLSGLKAGAAPEEIIRSVRAFASAESDKIGTPYIPQAVTWLNQRRWQDYAPVEEKPSGPIGWRPGLPTHEELLAGGTNERKTQAPGGNLRSESNRVHEGGNGKAGQGTERSDLSNNQARKSGMVSLGSVFQRVSGLRANGHDPDQK